MIYLVHYTLHQRERCTNNSTGKVRQQDKAKMSMLVAIGTVILQNRTGVQPPRAAGRVGVGSCCW